jgi:hypothetical protein
MEYELREFGWFARRVRKSFYDELVVSVIVGTFKSVCSVWFMK